MMIVVGNQMWLILIIVPNKRLIHKLEQYNITGKVMTPSWHEDVRG